VSPLGGPAARDRRAATDLAAQYHDGSYLEKVPDWHLAESPWKAGHVSRMIERNRLEVRHIADVGCGAGGVLQELQKRMGADVRFDGYDIAPEAIRLCLAHQNERLRYANADFIADASARAELVLLLDVFEHVPDYLGFLAALRKKGEWFIFHIPLDFSVHGLRRGSAWLLQMRRQHGHLHYFTHDTALATLRDLGYEITDTFYTDDQELRDQEDLPLKSVLRHRARRWLARRQPDLAARCFEGFNLMVLARAGA
jgi:SAM-dependent methyltransferase